MIVTKSIDKTKNKIPFMAALPYNISVDSDGSETAISYNPDLQITIVAGNRMGYSTCRESESVWNPLLGVSKTDTIKDD
jgi:hypothetical protein